MASPTLKELLAKRKAVTANGGNSNAKPVLQSETKQEITQTPQTTRGEERGISTQTNEVSLPATNATGNPMVEQGPPAGLSGIALIKWRKENAKLADSRSNNMPAAGKEVVTANVEKQGNNVSTDTNTDKLLSGTTAGNEIVATSPSQKADETKANDGTVQLEQLKKNLFYLANNIEQKELVGQVVRTIAIQLKHHPYLLPQMQNSDVDLVVRGLRSSYNIAARKKSEQREAKEKKSKVGDDVAQMFKEAGLGDLNLGLK